MSSAFGTLSFRNSRYRSQALPGCRIRREYPARCNASGSAIGLCPRCLRACVETVDERKGRRWVTSGLVDVIVGARSIQHNVMARSAKSIANRRGSWASPVVMLSRQDACLRSARRDWSKLSQSGERFAVGSGSYDVVQLSMGRQALLSCTVADLKRVHAIVWCSIPCWLRIVVYSHQHR